MFNGHNKTLPNYRDITPETRTVLVSAHSTFLHFRYPTEFFQNNFMFSWLQLLLTWKSAAPPGGRGTTDRQAGQTREGAGGGARDSRQVRQKVWKHGRILGRRHFSRQTAHVRWPAGAFSPPVAILSVPRSVQPRGAVCGRRGQRLRMFASFRRSVSSDDQVSTLVKTV